MRRIPRPGIISSLSVVPMASLVPDRPTGKAEPFINQSNLINLRRAIAAEL